MVAQRCNLFASCMLQLTSSYLGCSLASGWFSCAHQSGISEVCGVCYLCSYSTIAWAIPAHYGHTIPGTNTYVHPDYHLPYHHNVGGYIFEVFNALGTVAFAYAGHNVVLEIQATIPSTPERPSKIPMWRGVILAYIVVAACYFPVSLVGYWAYGNNNLLVSDGNILVFEGFPVWLVATANLMVVVHVMGSYQVLSFHPETLNTLVKSLSKAWIPKLFLAWNTELCSLPWPKSLQIVLSCADIRHAGLWSAGDCAGEKVAFPPISLTSTCRSLYLCW